MIKNGLSKCAAAAICSIIIPLNAAPRQSDVIGGPRGIHPYLFKSVSHKNLVETARDHQWSIQFEKSGRDTLSIIAIRIEFAMDTSTQTTGNGLFGIRGRGDKDEEKYYAADTVYKYDALPHDSLYFARQLDAVAKYFDKVSRGRLAACFRSHTRIHAAYRYVNNTAFRKKLSSSRNGIGRDFLVFKGQSKVGRPRPQEVPTSKKYQPAYVDERLLACCAQ